MKALRIYLIVIGAVLLIQGSVSLLLHEALDVDLSGWHGLLFADDRHAALHVVWGAVVIPVAVLAGDATLVGLGFVFGAFFVALAIAGIVVHNPFGLMLGWGQNAFHWIIGPLALVLAFAASRE